MIRMRFGKDWLSLEDGVWSGPRMLVDQAEVCVQMAQLRNFTYTPDRDLESATEVANVLRPAEIDMSQHEPPRIEVMPHDEFQVF
jgi:hypothetical protein